ncbi:unnamed protein product [Leuciscus chuanchicus]
MNAHELGVQPLVREGEIEVLESSMHSLDISKHKNQDSPDEEAVNDLRNTYIVMDDFWAHPSNLGLEDGDSSDEDFVPSLHLRTVGAKTDKLPEISVEEAVFDFVVSDSPVEESESVPDQQRVTTEEDLVGKCANITYNDNLLQLARDLKLPIKKCKHMDRLSGVPCPGVPPFQVTLKPWGIVAVLEWLCPFGHSQWKWNSQPTLKFGMQGGDFMLATNILLSGNNYRKVALLFKFMAMGMVTESTYYRIQDAYCIEPVQDFWDNISAKVMERMRIKHHIVVLANRKKAEARKTGGGPAPPPLTNAEEMALSLNAGRPMAEGIPGGTSSEPVTPEDLSAFIKYSDGKICLLEPPVPTEPQSVDDGDEETVSAATEMPTESVEEQQEDGPSTSGAQMNTVQ